jgi:hypothetical protein
MGKSRLYYGRQILVQFYTGFEREKIQRRTESSQRNIYHRGTVTQRRDIYLNVGEFKRFLTFFEHLWLIPKPFSLLEFFQENVTFFKISRQWLLAA